MKNPPDFRPGGSSFKSLAVSYSHIVIATLPSALSRFTSVFGMGTGGSNSLWPPGKLSGMPSFNARHSELGCSQTLWAQFSMPQLLNSSKMLERYMVKPHEQLVHVSF